MYALAGRSSAWESEFITGPYAGQAYQHNCGNDEEHYLPGPITAAYEERDGAWVVIGKYS